MPASGVRLCLLQPGSSPPGQVQADVFNGLCAIAAAAGHSVTQVRATETGLSVLAPDRGARAIAAQSIPERLVGPASAKAAYRVQEWLRAERFDIVCAPAEGGLLFYALNARQQGLAFQDTVFCVAADRLSLLSRHLAEEMPRDVDDLANDEMERGTLALADFCLFLDARAEDWVAQRGWTVPGLRGSAAIAGDTGAAAQAIWPELLTAARHARDRPTVAAAPQDRPLVSVCIPHFNRPVLVRQAIESVRRQTYDRVEIVVVDDASTAPEARAALDELEADLVRQGGMLVRHDTNRYLGAARNTAARHAHGTFLLFLDDDDYAKPEQIATLVQAAQATGADIVNSLCDRLLSDQPPQPDQQAEERWLTLGNAPTVGMLQNLFGTASALFRRSSFERIGGFTELRGVGCEDWEIFARASLAGMNFQTVPQALHWYRLTPDSMIQTGSVYAGAARVLAAYFTQVPPQLRPVLSFAHGAAVRLQALQNSLRHCEAVLRHRDAHIRDLEQQIASLTQLNRMRAEQLGVMHGELSELRTVCSIMLAGYGATPQAAVDTILHSRSWRAGGVLRGVLNRLSGHRPAAPPQVTTWVQAAAVINALQQSTSWELTGPLRALTRLTGRR